MAESQPSFLTRVSIALTACWRILTDGAFAQAAAQLGSGEGVPTLAEPEPVSAPKPLLAETQPDAALQLLGMLQQGGRFIDFLQEDVAAYSDTQVGAAARVIHEGCRKTLVEHMTIVPVRSEAEGSRVTLPDGFDSSTVRLTGKLVGQAPFSGNLTHRGWQVTELKLPKVATGHNLRILAPAEVEL